MCILCADPELSDTNIKCVDCTELKYVKIQHKCINISFINCSNLTHIVLDNDIDELVCQKCPMLKIIKHNKIKDSIIKNIKLENCNELHSIPANVFRCDYNNCMLLKVPISVSYINGQNVSDIKQYIEKIYLNINNMYLHECDIKIIYEYDTIKISSRNAYISYSFSSGEINVDVYLHTMYQVLTFAGVLEILDNTDVIHKMHATMLYDKACFKVGFILDSSCKLMKDILFGYWKKYIAQISEYVQNKEFTLQYYSKGPIYKINVGRYGIIVSDINTYNFVFINRRSDNTKYFESLYKIFPKLYGDDKFKIFKNTISQLYNFKYFGKLIKIITDNINITFNENYITIINNVTGYVFKININNMYIKYICSVPISNSYIEMRDGFIYKILNDEEKRYIRNILIKYEMYTVKNIYAYDIDYYDKDILKNIEYGELICVASGSGPSIPNKFDITGDVIEYYPGGNIKFIGKYNRRKIRIYGSSYYPNGVIKFVGKYDKHNVPCDGTLYDHIGRIIKKGILYKTEQTIYL